VSVNRALHLTRGQLIEVPVKTRTSRRSIDLDTTTVEILTIWRLEQQHLGRSLNDGPVFTGARGGRLNPDSLTQTFDRLAATVPVPRIRLHDLRHTHATLLIAAGVPVKVVSERLGHPSPAFTMVTYQHVLPGMQADAAARFAALLAA
jgi:integrase